MLKTVWFNTLSNSKRDPGRAPDNFGLFVIVVGRRRCCCYCVLLPDIGGTWLLSLRFTTNVRCLITWPVTTADLSG